MKVIIGKQQGLSLIELMISIVLAGFIALAITQIFSANIHTSRVAKNLGYVTEGGGFGTLLLTKYIRLTGYQNYFKEKTRSGVFPMRVVRDANNWSVDGVPNDRLVIEYEAPGRVESGGQQHIACDGDTVMPSAVVREEFRVINNQLICNSYEVLFGGGVDPMVVVNGSVLVADVEGFQVQYALAKDARSEEATSYLNANQLPAPTDVNQRLRAIRFSLLVRSDEPVAGVATAGFRLLDEPALIQPPGNAVSYRVYETTVAINNTYRGRFVH